MKRRVAFLNLGRPRLRAHAVRWALTSFRRGHRHMQTPLRSAAETALATPRLVWLEVESSKNCLDIEFARARSVAFVLVPSVTCRGGACRMCFRRPCISHRASRLVGAVATTRTVLRQRKVSRGQASPSSYPRLVVQCVQWLKFRNRQILICCASKLARGR